MRLSPTPNFENPGAEAEAGTAEDASWLGSAQTAEPETDGIVGSGNRKAVAVETGGSDETAAETDGSD